MSIYTECKILWNSDFAQVRQMHDRDYAPQHTNPWLWVDTLAHDPAPVLEEDLKLIPWWYNIVLDEFTTVNPNVVKPQGLRYIPTHSFWLDRFTAEERSVLWASLTGLDLSGVSFGDEKNRWRITVWRDLVSAGNVPLDHPETVWCINAMVLAGILTSGRPAEILGT